MVKSTNLPTPELFDDIQDGVLMFDKKWNYLYLNKQAEKLSGHAQKDLIGKNVWKVFPESIGGVLYRKYHEAMKNGKMVDIEYYYPQTAQWFNIHAYPSRTGLMILFTDITHKKQSESNLKFLSEASKVLSSSLDYQKTLEAVVKLAVPHISDWCSIDMLNKKGEVELLAVGHKDPAKVQWAWELRKKSPIDMKAKSGLPHVLRTGKSEFYPLITEEMIKAAAKNKQELELIRSIGFTSAIITPILMRGKVIGVIQFVTTETKRQFTYADLFMAEELASRAALAIENATLYKEAQKEIAGRKKLEKQKDEFIGVASHELKTPVTSIKAFAQVLRLRFRKEGNTQAAELLNKLDAQVDKLTSLIGDLLDVTKIEAGRMQFNETYFDFDELVNEFVEELQRTTDKHQLVKKGTTSKKIFGDRERIGQVITNLVSNAIKYSPYSKKIHIISSIEKDTVKLCVQDFGVGIPKEKQEKVFERFFRVSGPGTETYPGLGLGLYISSEIIKREGGKIWVESAVGKGSTFCFTLPLKTKKNKISPN